MNYNISSKENERFDGVNIDIEPYIAPEFKTKKPSLQRQYLDLLQTFMDRKKAAGSGIYVGAAIPRWYDSSSYAENITWGKSGQETTKWLSQHVQDIVDYISIMDYRDQAEGSAGIIAQAQGEIDYAKEIGKPNSVVLGVETKDIADGGDPEVISFREEGRSYMEQELDKVENAFGNDAAYGGIALHHYDTIRYLPSEWSSDAVYWKPPADSKPPTRITGRLSAVPFDYQSVTLTYGRAYDNQEVEEYRIYRSTTPWFFPNEENYAGSSRGLDFNDTGLLPDTTYFYKVAAVDVNGNTGPVSFLARATTKSTELKPMIIHSASLEFDGSKGNVQLKVVDKETNEGLKADVGGRFTMLSGKYVNINTEPSGEAAFSSESLGNKKGKLGFKVNNVNKPGYYWASAYDENKELTTEWSKQTTPIAEDSYVRSGANGDENYGSSTLLEIKDVLDSISSQYDRVSLLKFNLNSMTQSNVTHASLHFYVDRSVTDSTVSKVPVTLTGLTGDQWSEETVTWNTRPAVTEEASPIGTMDITSKGWYTIDITDYVNKEMDDKIITLQLSDTNGTDRSVKVHSKENDNPAYVEWY
ncbi:DNRLRE domain-containing protein [Halobacillus salinarum]|uniref:DNRLRE domain-containing protein n=1 Tax=Halobacillus salinarum TaxID=2932257 RepID=A0ABY4EI61_9BACI|nr:DNRLRE domain-containing protein [Halobacillus salinarum]UOQ44166.1 DNRLRE domain-containing protein [Halobacillus salinarum]